jgi:gamma-glutamyltranspeptidase/glutathione hydrolase
MAAERTERWQIRKPAARSPHGVVTSQHYSAAEAGAAVLEAGGNAVDAAVAAGFSLQTCEPWMTSLTACGYMLVIEPDGTVECIDFSGQAPNKVDMDRYAMDPAGAKSFLGMPAAKDLVNIKGYSAFCTPGVVRGFEAALKRHGSWSWDHVLQPAIERARNGLYVSWHTTLCIGIAAGDLAADPGTRAVLMPGGAPPEPGETLPLTQLAATLQRLAEAGPDDFYRGRIAEKLIADVEANGGAVTADDLAAYQAKTFASPTQSMAGKTFHVAGPTSGGRRFLETMAHFDQHHGKGPVGPQFYAEMVKGVRKAFASHRARNEAALAQKTPVDLAKAASTTHVNVIDRDGRMVALTFTMLQRFGARVLSPSTGIMLNNGMAWFDPRPDRLNSLRPGAWAPTNMCPIAITERGKPFAVLGAAGGNQIVPTVSQLAAMLTHAGLDVETAMNLPRMTTGAVDDIVADLDMPEDCLEALRALGPVKQAERSVYPRPFGSPGMAALRDGKAEGMPDTTYPSSQAVAAGKPHELG